VPARTGVRARLEKPQAEISFGRVALRREPQSVGDELQMI
jgi:hypothetical protein